MGKTIMSKKTGMWSEEIPFVLYTLKFICLGSEDKKKPRMSGWPF